MGVEDGTQYLHEFIHEGILHVTFLGGKNYVSVSKRTQSAVCMLINIPHKSHNQFCQHCGVDQQTSDVPLEQTARLGVLICTSTRCLNMCLGCYKQNVLFSVVVVV